MNPAAFVLIVVPVALVKMLLVNHFVDTSKQNANGFCVLVRCASSKR